MQNESDVFIKSRNDSDVFRKSSEKFPVSLLLTSNQFEINRKKLKKRLDKWVLESYYIDAMKNKTKIKKEKREERKMSRIHPIAKFTELKKVNIENAASREGRHVDALR